MDVDVLPLAEVDLKVGDVAIEFGEDKEGLESASQQESYEDFDVKNTLEFLKNEVEDYEEVNVHFLSDKGDPNDPPRRFQCEDCGKYFIRNEHLKNHKRTHTGERPYECDSCQRSFAKHFDLTRHKQYVHGTVTTFFICEECGRTFSRKDHLKSHLVTHKNQACKVQNGENLLKTFTCETCGRTYCRLENLKKHMQKHFDNIESTNCDSKSILSDLKSEDIIIRGFNFHFMSSDEMAAQEDTTLKSFPCDYCGRLFMRKDHLKNHERTHTGERPFQCEQCDRRFAKRFVMTRHLQNVHRINTKLHDCTECEKKFARRDHLKNHMKIHILAAVRSQQPKDKTHKCNVCGREFTRSDNLKTHMKIHLLAAVRKRQEEGEEERIKTEIQDPETYSCGICGKNFSSPRKLRKHEGKHKKDEYNS